MLPFFQYDGLFFFVCLGYYLASGHHRSSGKHPQCFNKLHLPSSAWSWCAVRSFPVSVYPVSKDLSLLSFISKEPRLKSINVVAITVPFFFFSNSQRICCCKHYFPVFLSCVSLCIHPLEGPAWSHMGWWMFYLVFKRVYVFDIGHNIKILLFFTIHNIILVFYNPIWHSKLTRVKECDVFSPHAFSLQASFEMFKCYYSLIFIVIIIIIIPWITNLLKKMFYH